MAQHKKTASEACNIGETSRLSVAVGASRHGKSTLCVTPIAAGETVFRITGRPVARQDRHTVQIGADQHLAPEGEPWAFVNHGCEPNCVVVFETAVAGSARMVARRPIAPGEEITFNYLTTEWDMASPFDCRCGAAVCAGTIRGFRHLERPAREALRPWLAPFLAERIDSEAVEASFERPSEMRAKRGR